MSYQPELRYSADVRPRINVGLIHFAWTVEIFGILLGIANSVSITFPKELPITISGWLPALPVAVLAGFELLRIPLAKAFQETPRVLPRLLALVGIVALVGIAFENWTFGLERTVNQRIAPVELLRDDVRQVQQAIASQSAVNDSARVALQQQVETANRELEIIEQQIAAEHTRHNDNMDRVKECLKLAIICYQAELNKESKRYDTAKGGLEARRDQIAASRDKANAELLALSTNGDTNKMDALRQTEAHAIKALTNEVKDNPLYRIASAVYGIAPASLTDEQVANARAFFAIFGAGIVSFTGTAAALIHYWPKHGSSKLAWALRAYIARLRRKVVRIEKVEVPVERIVEKIVAEVETPVLIEKTIVRFIPYTGEGPLPSDETTIKRVEGHPAEEALTTARTNNASHLRIFK
jgi:hypothetical protein